MTTPSRTLAHVGQYFLGLLFLATIGGCERVEVTSAGFQPSRIDAGTARALVFRRTTNETCATSVVFPALGFEKPLPLHTDVAVDLTAWNYGRARIPVRDGLDRGKVIVR